MNKGRLGKRILWTMGLLLIGVVGYLVFHYWEQARAAHPQYETIQSGILKHQSQVEVTFINEETVLQAPKSGKLNLAVKESQRVRRGDSVGTVGEVTGGAGVQITAPAGGLYVSQTDGLENIYTVKNLLEMNLTQVFNNPDTIHKPGEEVQYGEAIGKIVNNLVQTAAFIEFPSLKGINVGDTLKFEINGQSNSAKILRKIDQPMGIIVQFSGFIDSSLNKRKDMAMWLSAPSQSGVLVSKSALWNKGEEKGVLAVINGIITFKKVQVIDENENQACLEGISAGMVVVTNPRADLEGKIAR